MSNYDFIFTGLLVTVAGFLYFNRSRKYFFRTRDLNEFGFNIKKEDVNSNESNKMVYNRSAIHWLLMGIYWIAFILAMSVKNKALSIILISVLLIDIMFLFSSRSRITRKIKEEKELRR